MRSLLLTALLVASPAWAGKKLPPPLSRGEIVQAVDDARPSKKTFQRAAITATTSDDPIDRAAAVAFLYGWDASTWEEALYREFSVKDFAARQDGEVTWLDPEAVRDSIGAIDATMESAAPRWMVDLVAFQTYRDDNAWVRTASETLSVARLLRSQALGGIWGEAARKGQVDTVRVLNRLDARAKVEELGAGSNEGTARALGILPDAPPEAAPAEPVEEPAEPDAESAAAE